MKYKLSKYNYFYQQDIDTYTCINLINKTIFAIDAEKYKLIQNYTDNIEVISNINPSLFSALNKLGIIIEKDFNEINFLIAEHRKTIYSTNNYRLTIMPTLECNFKCWYCYEDRIAGRMTQETMQSIFKHVKNIIENYSVKNLQLDWFGGEPLICFDDVVFNLSKKIKKFCIDKHITFNNVITTNGALINSDMVKKFKQIDLRSFQITLDGNEKHHNRVKKVPNGESMYRKTINNILEIIDQLSDPTIMLRINYTEQNLQSINEIINDIPENYRKKIEITLQQVWQTEKVNDNIDIVPCNEKFSESGFIAPLYKLEGKFYRCYADLLSQVVINYNGDIFKCTARDFAHHEPEGKIQKDGSIKWNNVYFKRLSSTTVENEICLSCNFLPACWGPCSQKVLEQKEGEFDQICNKAGIEKTIKILMTDFYKTNILN